MKLTPNPVFGDISERNFVRKDCKVMNSAGRKEREERQLLAHPEVGGARVLPNVSTD